MHQIRLNLCRFAYYGKRMFAFNGASDKDVIVAGALARLHGASVSYVIQDGVTVASPCPPSPHQAPHHLWSYVREPRCVSHSPNCSPPLASASLSTGARSGYLCHICPVAVRRACVISK